MTHRISGVVSPQGTKCRRVDDYAVPRKHTRGQKLTGSRWSRATAPVVRRIGEDTTPITPEQVAANTWKRDGLGPYSEIRGKMYAN